MKFAEVMVAGFVAAGLQLDPDPVTNVAKCVSCGNPTYQSIAADLNREPPLCTACSHHCEENP